MDSQPRKMMVEELGRHAPELANHIAAQARDEQPELFTSDFYSAMLQSTRANIDLFTEFLASDGDARTIRVGSTIRLMAHSMVARGLPLSTLIMLFHSTHNIVEHRLLVLAQHLFADYKAEDVLEILEELRVMTNLYVRTRANQLAAIYSEEAARLKTPGDPGLLAQVNKVLADPTRVANIGNYRMSGSHVAFSLWAQPSAQITTEQLAVAAKTVAQHLGSQGEPLVVYPSSMIAWGWVHVDQNLHTPGRIVGVDDKALAKELPKGVSVAIATRADGSHGFRYSHGQSDRLRKLAERGSVVRRPVISAEMDGALTAAAFVDRLPLAKLLVVSSLGELAIANDYNRVIVQTARSFLRHGIAGAAVEMRAHRNTVKYRIDKFREVVGNDQATSSEVHLAVELAHWYGSSVLIHEQSTS